MEFSVIKIIFEKGFSHLREREIESVLSIGNGYIGTRNSLEETYPGCDPVTFIGNFYVQGPDDEFNFLVKIPDWTRIKVFLDGELLTLEEQEVLKHSRFVSFDSGLAVREWQNQDANDRITTIKITKFVSLAEKNLMGKLVEITPENYTGNLKVMTGLDCEAADFEHLLNMNSESEYAALVHMKTKYGDKELKMFQKSWFEEGSNDKYYIENSYSGSYENFEWKAELGNTYVIKGLCSVLYGDNQSVDENMPAYFTKGTGWIASSKISGTPRDNISDFDWTIGNHIAKWQKRWRDSKITIEGNPYDQKLINFAVYHLIHSGEFSGNDCSIPARNLSGEAYKGHVFWETEIYLLPFYILTNPERAKALLMYRYTTLDGARKNAIEEGKKGASYAWESTDTGLEAAPSMVILPNGEVIEILSRNYENHISSDIAYAVWKYWEATGDDEFIVNYGAEILFETARYCESLIKEGDDGLYHINKVIGPDEYHELVDDNAYTNYLVRNNFDVAVKAKNMLGIKDEEIGKWEQYRDNIYSGLNPKTGLYEQFKGFYNLEYIDLLEYEPRTVPMDIILGRGKTSQSQVIKQPDVLMFMFLFPERFSKEDIALNYDFYEKRCGHGSSLSPGIHSAIAAKVGKTDEAYKYFLKNAQIDIGDKFGNASGGVHIGSFGAVWLSVVMGFAGLSYTEEGFTLDPNLPEEWDSIRFSICWKGERKDIYIDRENIITS